MSCASRLVQHLPLSLLEVSTAAHAFCTLVTYFVWWSKPLNIPVPTVLRGKEAQEVHALLTCEESEYDEALEVARRIATGDSSTTTERKKKKITLAASALQHLLPNPEKPPKFHSISPRTKAPGSDIIRSRQDSIYEGITTAVSCIIYGLVHLAAWNVHFPTPLERLLYLSLIAQPSLCRIRQFDT